jgi:hypothetical protein
MSENKANEDFVRVEVAASKTGFSVPTLYRLLHSKRVRSVAVPITGRKPETRVSLTDLQQLTAAKPTMAPAVAVKPAHRPPVEALAAMAALLRPLPDPKPALTLKAAAAASGLPVAYLRCLIRTREVDAVKAGAWYISRASLERFINAGFKLLGVIESKQ